MPWTHKLPGLGEKDLHMAERCEHTAKSYLARFRLRPLIHHLFLPSLALGPGILLRDDVRVVATSHVIPAGNAGT
uniref:Uncharacterized protein n=1 Tax=Candidatus Kentrum sp. FW TaxID=2126338 RepID=A0A450U0V3_9GAMM|nr:MAG: hypothetical protein BECKFW1821C_GA0114237_109416 [Candidatus Kentron sp. FW]